MGAIGNLSDFLLPPWLSPGKHTIRSFLISHGGGKPNSTQCEHPARYQKVPHKSLLGVKEIYPTF